MPVHDTLLSFVNSWECDENDHLNVQYYFERFEESERQFRLLTGFSESQVGARRVRHVRYHREARVGTLLKVGACICFDGPHVLTVLHELRDANSGQLIATAIDGYNPAVDAARTLRSRFKDSQEAMAEAAAPRGLSATPPATRATLDGVLANGGQLTHRSTVLARNLGSDGRADDTFALGCFTQAAPFVWERTPLTRDALQAMGAGRVAVEMKLAWASPVKAGDSVVVASGVTGCQASTFTMRHHMYEARTGRLVCICDAVVLPMSLQTRRALPLNPDQREAILRLKID
ncbi:thioesterase [Microvirga tunisiensis]|uniref:Thioesterase n=2 Tax=Pannonibacter tanglangensis TaxID=2750084 RepID=A0A7X5F315_9HYPH|nr:MULTISPECIES: thioesterase family protein [unclassified Pannonibacter]NBN64260.1 thioesterase [Pannonibacter sp. XCT-34]NBN78793.1 thioesterase [Pannonibacter sp. XCT-53]